IHLRCQRQSAPCDFQVNATALRSYVQQLRPLCEELGLRDRGEVLLAQALSLPGVVPEPGLASFDLDTDWPVLERVLEQALHRLQGMRQEEGRAMAQELLNHRDQIGLHLERIRERAPGVATLFRDRLLERVRSLLGELDVQIDRNDLIREVSIYAERSDV